MPRFFRAWSVPLCRIGTPAFAQSGMRCRTAAADAADAADAAAPRVNPYANLQQASF
jgi:hypothetical protein